MGGLDDVQGDGATDTGREAMAQRWLEVRGKVQNVMFRQTLIRAMLRRELEGGASNDRGDKKLVRVTLRGDPERVEELVTALRRGVAINSWGAKATSVKDVTAVEGMELHAHQVTTANVDGFNWNPNVNMFI